MIEWAVEAGPRRLFAPRAARPVAPLGNCEPMAVGWLSLPGRPERAVVDDAQPLSIGRAAGNDVVLDDPAASREHALLRTEDGGFVVQDLGSANGTRVNGTPVEVARLADGDRLAFGATEGVFHTYLAPAAAPRGRRGRA